jgi:hypothetical protein
MNRISRENEDVKEQDAVSFPVPQAYNGMHPTANSTAFIRKTRMIVSLCARRVDSSVGRLRCRIIMRNKILWRFTLLAAVLLISRTAAVAQSATVVEEPDEYGFLSISCGAGRATYEYQSRSGEKIVVFARKYESVKLADEVLERSVKSALKVLERENPVNEQGPPLGLRVIAQFPDKVVIFERKGLWLSSTEAASLEGLMKFDAYEKRTQRARSGTRPNKSINRTRN